LGGVPAQDPAGTAAIMVIEFSDRDVGRQCSPFAVDT
jgi:hypothetical protein